MKKNILSLAVAASATGIASLASAQMYINTEHTGEALVFPFFLCSGWQRHLDQHCQHHR